MAAVSNFSTDGRAALNIEPEPIIIDGKVSTLYMDRWIVGPDGRTVYFSGRLFEEGTISNLFWAVKGTYDLGLLAVTELIHLGKPNIVAKTQSQPITRLSSAPLAVPDDASGEALGLSLDGQTAVGYYDNGLFTPYHAFRWTQSSDVVDLGTLDPANNASRSSFATDVSSDGAVVVGYSETVGGATSHAFRWTAAGGLQDLGSGAGLTGASRALGVSADGSVIVGESDFPGGFGTVRQAFRWTQAGGFQKLGALATDFPSAATAVNADGSVVVGVSGVEVTVGNSSINGSRAFRWSQTSGMQNLSAGLGNTTSAATDVSDDGATVVGIFDPLNNTGSFLPNGAGGRFSFGTGNRAFQWTAATGSADFNQLLVEAGADLAGATIVAATGISPDGTWIIGEAVTPTTGPNETVGAAASLTFVPLPQTARLLNLSTRGLAQSGDNVLIPGFVVSGSASKRLLIRAVGPTLSPPPFGLGNSVAPDPQLTLKRLNTAVQPPVYVDVAANDDWGTNSNAADITTTAANLFAFPLGNAKEAALLMDLIPGQYTITAGPSSSSGPATDGIMIVELYDANDYATDSRLINISTRGFCGVGAQVMIPGFVVSSESPKTVLVRVVGPTLGSFGVAGTLADPKLEIFPAGASTPIITNDNWGDDATAATTTAQVAAQVLAFALTAGSKDAALVVTLAPGNYTVVGSSAVTGGTGVVLVEVYVVP